MSRALYAASLRAGDFVALALALALFAAVSYVVYGRAAAAALVCVEGRDGRWLYPLDASVQLAVPGPLGVTHIELAGGSVRVVSSPCKNQTCVTMGAARGHGQWLACLPNQVLVTINDEAADTPDAGTW